LAHAVRPGDFPWPRRPGLVSRSSRLENPYRCRYTNLTTRTKPGAFSAETLKNMRAAVAVHY
jgi:hypothetical protein